VSPSVSGESAPNVVERALDPFRPTLAVVMRRVVFSMGTDVTDANSRRPTVVLAPHPDDETLGAGVMIMRKVEAGTPVHVVVVTDGSKSPQGDPAEVTALRARELDAARTVLGLAGSDVTRLGFVDAELDTAGEVLVDAIADVVSSLRPADVVVTADTDPHADHAALARAAHRAVAGRAVRVLTYPIWQFERPGRLVRQMWRSGRPELVSTTGYMERKRAAIAAYPSQMAVRDDDPEGLGPTFMRSFDVAYEAFFPTLASPRRLGRR